MKITVSHFAAGQYPSSWPTRPPIACSLESDQSPESYLQVVAVEWVVAVRWNVDVEHGRCSEQKHWGPRENSDYCSPILHSPTEMMIHCALPHTAPCGLGDCGLGDCGLFAPDCCDLNLVNLGMLTLLKQ